LPHPQSRDFFLSFLFAKGSAPFESEWVCIILCFPPTPRFAFYPPPVSNFQIQTIISLFVLLVWVSACLVDRSFCLSWNPRRFSRGLFAPFPMPTWINSCPPPEFLVQIIPAPPYHSLFLWLSFPQFEVVLLSLTRLPFLPPWQVDGVTAFPMSFYTSFPSARALLFAPFSGNQHKLFNPERSPFRKPKHIKIFLPLHLNLILAFSQQINFLSRTCSSCTVSIVFSSTVTGHLTPFRAHSISIALSSSFGLQEGLLSIFPCVC